MNICKFCGEEGKFQRRDGSWCCSKNAASCPEIKKRMSNNHADVNGINNPMFGKKMSEESIKLRVEKRIGLPAWNKGKTGIYSKETLLSISTKQKLNWENPDSVYNSPEIRILWSNQRKGKDTWNKGKTGIFSEETLERISIGSKNNWAKSLQRGFDQSMLLRMGLGLKMIKAIKNPSGPEIKLRNMVKELYPECEFQYGVLNYAIDVALPEYKIGIEYDGYYHFDCQKSLDYYKNREERIINQGWVLIHYTMFKKLPTIDEIKNDIELQIEKLTNK